MSQPASTYGSIAGLIAARVVRYDELRPCTTAFIDTRTPGSARKENFTIIGPGVAENPEQYVHIDIPHGFNVGGARQPPGCINSQHSHETAEVFIVHSGRWAFLLGPNQEDGEIVLGPGDTISIPTNVFRGFKNIGDDVGFLFAVLGGDDPGHVTWAPYVFENARQYGLVLLEDGSLVDTARGQKIPPGLRPMPPTTDDDVLTHDRPTADDLLQCVVRHESLDAPALASLPEIREYPIIGESCPVEGLSAGQMDWPHGFHLRHMTIDPDVASRQHSREEEEVILMHKGRLNISIADGNIELGPGDVFSVPVGAPRSFANNHGDLVEAYIVRGGNQPAAPKILN